MLKTFYAKITMADGGVWYASAVQTHRTVEATCTRLNALAEQRGIGARYEQATKAEYLAYREKLQKEIDAAKKKAGVDPTAP